MSPSPLRLVRGLVRLIWRLFWILVFAIVGAAIISRIAGNAREKWPPDQAAPTVGTGGRVVEAGDLKLFLQEAGPANGTPVVLFHGTGAWSEIWRETMTALAQAGFRAIAIDVPPFGYSGKPKGPDAYSPDKQAKRISAALDALGLRKAVFVAHSVGARPAVETVLMAPGRIDRLVLVDAAMGFGAEGSAEFQQPKPTLPMMALFRVRNVRDAAMSLVATNPLATRMFFKSFVSNKEAVTDARVLMLQQPLVCENITSAEGDWFQYLTVSEDHSRVSDFKNFAKLTMPVLLIWGSTDTVTPLWQGRQLQKLIPQAELSVMENVGHIPYIENPKVFNDRLVNFLSKASADTR